MHTPCVNPQIKPYHCVNDLDVEYVTDVIRSMSRGTRTTSGFLAGELHGGPVVQLLEERWSNVFKTKYAVSFNSGTSALLAACHAAGFSAGKNVVVPALSMSATASMPAFLGASLIWADVNARSFCAHPQYYPNDVRIDGVIVTNLFGRADGLHVWREFCDNRDIPLIEDNCQAPFAVCNGRYAGNWGDIGVFSLNVHKHMQCGEGGIALTSDPELARAMRLFRNHGETVGGSIGLNLRMTELVATMALAQLMKGERAVQRARELARKFTEVIQPYADGLDLILPTNGEANSFYVYPILFNRDRNKLVNFLKNEAVPIEEGYAPPLWTYPALAARSLDPNPECPSARLVSERISLIELCAINPTDEQIRQVGNAFEYLSAKHATLRTP